MEPNQPLRKVEPNQPLRKVEPNLLFKKVEENEAIDLAQPFSKVEKVDWIHVLINSASHLL